VTEARTFRPVRGVRAYERVVEQIEQAILAGELRPGDRLPSERELIVQMGVGRSTVREALRVLESNGLVRSRPGDPNGPEVMPLTSAGLQKSMTHLLMVDKVSRAELLQFRLLLDGVASYLAARRRDAAALADIEKAMERMRTSLDAGAQEFSDADAAFHDLLAKASGNALIELCCAAVRGVVVELIASKLVSVEDAHALMEQSLRHHEDVLESVRNGDADRAARLSRAHLFEYYGSSVDATERAMLEEMVAGGGLPG
jgi:DNA-binding FadR family transcriptional regulator